MTYTLLLSLFAGVASAIVSGGNCFQSPRHFGIFLLFIVPAAIIGAALDSK